MQKNATIFVFTLYFWITIEFKAIFITLEFQIEGEGEINGKAGKFRK